MKEKYPVIDGAETFIYKGNEVGILLSHGFVGTPQSVQFIGEQLAKYGYTVLAPRLPGHGTHYHDLENCTYEDWFEALEKGYKFLAQECSIVFVIGQSMGGTLTLKLAHKYPEIQGIATINAALTLPSFDYLKNSQGPQYLPEGDPDIKAKGVYEITYDQTPLKAIHQLQALMTSMPRILADITPPILCIKSSVDHVVPPENTTFIYKKVGSKVKNLVTLDNSYHVASMDNDKQKIVEHVHSFVQQQLTEKLVASYS
ncbi:MAG: alpha/beta hydrolase [Bacillota bacterium]